MIETGPRAIPKTFNAWAHVIASEIAELVISKQHDYGHGNILAFGEKGIVVRVNDKVERLKNVTWKTKGEPQNETIEDTWLDLAGYAIIALMLRRGVFTLPLEGEDDSSRSS